MDMDVVGNKERLLKGILDGETTTDIEPAGNEERLLYGILKGETESNIEPASRVERLLKAILENGGGGGGGTGVVAKTIVGTIANPFSVEEANEIWNAIYGGTGDAHLTFTLPSFGSVTARFSAKPFEEGVNVLLASITAPVRSQVAALCLMYLVQENNLFLAQKLAYAITPSSEPSVMDASALISNNLTTLTALTKYNTQLVLDSLYATYNGTYDAPDGVAYDPVTVNVAPNVGSKSITANGNYSSSSDNLDGYSSVTVNVAAVSKLPQVVDRTVTEITAADLTGVTAIGPYAFANCASLRSVTFPQGLQSIGNGAFMSCSVLQDIVLPSSVTTIGTAAFQGAQRLTSITIPSGVTRISDKLFAQTPHLTSVTLPTGLTEIGSEAFTESGITSITIPQGVTKIGTSAFAHCMGLTSVTIPEGVTKIDQNVFNGCTITSVSLPSTVTEIAYSAFSGCADLASITIPENVTKIGQYSFLNCILLSAITFPASVTKIDGYSFRGCTNLANVTVMSTTPPTLGAQAFTNTSANLVIYVPAASVSAYQAASGWSTYASKIQAIPTT